MTGATSNFCTEILTRPPRKGEVCGLPARVDGYCENHGPKGENARRREANRLASLTCEAVITRGKRKGQPCGDPHLVPGKSVCFRHDPDRAAAQIEARNANRDASGRRCKGRTSDGEQCPKWASPGLDVCNRHGAGTPRSKAKSAAFVRTERSRKILERLGVDVGVVTNPYVALQHHAAQLIAWRDHCLEQVMALDPSEMRYSSQQELEQVRGEVQIYQKAAQDATTALSALARMQVDEHLAAIHAATLAMLLSALRDALAIAGLDATAAGQVKAEFAKRVRVIEGSVEDGGDGKGKAA